MSYSSHAKQAELYMRQVQSQAFYGDEALTRVKDYAYYFIESIDEPSEKFTALLEEHIARLRPTNEDERARYNVLNFWLLRLKTFLFASLSRMEKIKYLQAELVPSLKLGIDVLEGIERYFSIFPEDMARETGREFTQFLSKSQSSIGSLGNVAQLIDKYNIFANRQFHGSSRPSALDLVTFLGADETMRKLSSEEKELVRKVLSIYNRLLNYRKESPDLAVVKPTPLVYQTPASLEVKPVIREQMQKISPVVLQKPSIPPVMPKPAPRPQPQMIKPVEQPKPTPPKITPPTPVRQEKILPPPPMPHRKPAPPPIIERPQVAPRERIVSPPASPVHVEKIRPPDLEDNIPAAPVQGRIISEIAEKTAPPAKPQFDEKLYHSTLEELARQRLQFEKTEYKPQQAPSELQPFSINEALVQGSYGNKDRGVIVPGKEEIEDKLDSLEKKLDAPSSDEKTE